MTAGVAVRHGLATRTPVFIAKNQRYDGQLAQTVSEGLTATGLGRNVVSGRVVLLKPNLVEPASDAPHITTHPALVLAAADVFRGWGAKVLVGEAPGNFRDTEAALIDSGMQVALDAAGLNFADLNYEEARWVPNRGGASKLPGFYIPRVVASADVIVSMPKLKTHHWIGMTAALKNMYGILPGLHYGWPKNILHHAGIPETVFDINASLPCTATIVDAIDCMEGDGPIMGSRKALGLVVVGTNLTAVDAICAKIMGLDPARIAYLHMASSRLGPIREDLIVQRGENWRDLVHPFAILDLPHLRHLRAASPRESQPSRSPVRSTMARPLNDG
jgi:uncharacterized protein (DUF362 family)